MANPFAKKLTPTPTQEDELKSAVRAAIAKNDTEDSEILDVKFTPEVIPQAEAAERGAAKLSRLIDDNFPFDESQLRAIRGMVKHQYACLTGAAGTGKTTTTKKLVDTLLNETDIESVNMSEYFKRGVDTDDAEDDYEIPENYIPAICMVGFTGRSAQMIKRNFPRDWHGNIMTIHRMLAYVPEYFDDFDEEGDLKRKMRFVPTYGADCKLPWDIIIIDEAGMVGLDLWHNVLAAAKDGCRIYFIGDINQLPPVHGRSVFGFAMDRFPSYELTHIHRQAGTDNPIVDNAWRVLKGQMPISQGRFQMVELKGDAQQASRQVRAMMPKLKEREVYDPIRDTIITPINGEEGARGFALGQLPLNREFALIFNPQSANPRYIIDGGREKKHFAIGDKVMATKNDHEAGITNGMTGIITDISVNQGYGGDHRRFGRVEEVNEYLRAEGDLEEEDFTLESLHDDMNAMEKGREEKKEKRDRGPSSHVVTVRFGDAEHGFELPFQTLGEVGSLMTAYVVTCHKMQGGESPTIVIICHDAHKQMMYREWLYTAITRASQMCILLYTPTALRTALSKQSIKGSTLKEKIAYFNALGRNNGLGATVNVTLPAYSWNPEDEEVIESAALPATRDEQGSAPPVEAPVRENPLQRMVGRVTIKTTTVHVHVHAAPAPEPDPATLESVRVEPVQPPQEQVTSQPRLMLESTAAEKGRLMHMHIELDTMRSRWNEMVGYSLRFPRLTHQPAEPEPPKKPNAWAAMLKRK